MTNWRWVRLDVVLAIHDRALALFGGGAEGVRDMGVLESALARPQNLAAYGKPDIAELAALYVVGIAKAHAFLDGNKRTAWAVGRAFLEYNGYVLAFDKADAVRVMTRVADSQVNPEEMAGWLRARLSARSGGRGR